MGRQSQTHAQDPRGTDAPVAARDPIGLVALDVWLSPAEQIVIVGKNNAPGTREMVASIWRLFLPGVVWALIGDEASHGYFARHADFYASLRPVGDKSTAYVCKDFVCNLPVTDLAAFERELAAKKKPTPAGG